MRNYNYSFSSGIGARKIDDTAWDPVVLAENGMLSSRVFIGSEVLNEVLASSDADFAHQLISETHPRGEHIFRLHLALKIILPQYAEVTDKVGIMGTTIGEEYGSLTESWLRTFQEGFNEEYSTQIGLLDPPFRELDETGKLDSSTLFFLDFELKRIKFYDIEKEKIIHNSSRAHHVCTYTRAMVDFDMLDEPSSGATATGSRISAGDRVWINQITPENWCFIENEEGEQGYIPAERTGADDYIWTKSAMPDPMATLYKIQSGDTMLGMVDDFFNLDQLDDDYGLDFRFYANVLIFLNNPEGETTKTIYKLNKDSGKFDLESSGRAGIVPETSSSWKDYIWQFPLNPFYPYLIREDADWEDAETTMQDVSGTSWDAWRKFVPQTDYYIWVPSKPYALYCRELVNSGSLSGNYMAAFEEVNDNLFTELNSYFTHWPRGTGVKLEAGVGATFGWPVSLDLNFEGYIWREDTEDEDEVIIKVIKTGIVEGGLDAGAGVGVSIGKPKRPRANQYNSKKQSMDFGLEVAGSLRLGVKVKIEQEFTFKLSETKDVAAIFVLMTSQSMDWNFYAGPSFSMPTKPSGVPKNVGKLMVTLFDAFDIDPMDYVTRYTIEPAIYFYLGYTVIPGFRARSHEIENPVPKDRVRFTRQELEDYKAANPEPSMVNIEPNMVDGEETGRSPFDQGKWWMPTWLSYFFSSFISSSIDAELVLFRIDVEISDGYVTDPTIGVRMPAVVNYKVSFDGEASAGGLIPWLIPSIKSYIPATGGGIALGCTLDYNGLDIFTNGTFLNGKGIFLELYQKKGDTRDSRIRFAWDLTSVSTAFPTTLTGLMAIIDKVSIKRRIDLGEFISSKEFRRIRKFKNHFRNLVMAEEFVQKAMFAVNSYVEAEFAITGTEAATFVTNIAGLASSPTGIADLILHITDILVGKKPIPIPDQSQWMSFLLTVLEVIDIYGHLEVGGSFSLGGKIGGGAKIRGTVNLGLMAVFHYHLSRRLREFLTKGDTSPDNPSSTIIFNGNDLVNAPFSLSEFTEE